MRGVEVEVIGLAVGRLQYGHAVTPRIVAALAAGKVVQRAQAEKVEGRHIGQAGPVAPVAWQLCIEGAGDGQILFYGDKAGMRQFCTCLGNLALQNLLAGAIQGEREMVFTKHKVATGQFVHGLVEFDDLAHATVTGRDHHALGPFQRTQSGMARVRGEGLGDDVFEIKVLQSVQHTRPGGIRVLLDVEHRAIVIAALRRTHDKVTAPRAEEVPGQWQIFVDRCRQDRHRVIAAVQQVAVELQRLREHCALFRLIHAEPGRYVIMQYRFDVPRQLQHLGDGLVLLGPQLAQVA